MSPRLRLLLLSPAFRWTVVLLVLLVAGAIALWPRQQPSAAAPPPPPAQNQRPATSDLPCPRAAAPGAARPALGGADASCLGDRTPVDAAAALAARNGRPTLVNVWATWCPPCREELPVLQRYSERAGADREGAANLVGMQIDSAPAEGRALLDRLGVEFPMLYDSGEAVSRQLGVPYALPASYLVGTDGRVRFVAEPRVFRSVADVQRAVARYGGTDG